MKKKMWAVKVDNHCVCFESENKAEHYLSEMLASANMKLSIKPIYITDKDPHENVRKWQIKHAIKMDSYGTTEFLKALHEQYECSSKDIENWDKHNENTP